MARRSRQPYRLVNKREEIIARAKDDLLYFGRAITPAMFTVRSADFHDELANAWLDRSNRRVNVQAPRGHAKSSIIAGIGPLHDVIHDEGNTFIVLVSKTEGHAVRLLQTIKDVLDYSPHFRALYGYWGRQAARAWTTTIVELVDPKNPQRKIALMARGANQQMRGLKYINQRPTRVVYDDPEDETNTITEESREKTMTGLMKGILPGLDPHVGCVWVIGTPIHGQGMVNVLESNPSFLNLKYKALNPKEGAEDEKIEANRYWALWPEVWPVEKLIEDRESAAAMGRISHWYSEYQCEIVGDSDQLFRKEDLRYWEGELKRDLAGDAYLEITSMGPVDDMQQPEKTKVPVNLFMGIDPASSTSRRADYSAVFVLGMDESKNIYCVDYLRKRLKPFDLADEIVRMYRKYKPERTQIESVGYQEMLRQYLREHVDDHIAGLEIKNTPRTAKSERLSGLQPEFALGKVFLKPWMVDFETELITFPRGKHDDTLDAYYYARKRAYIPYHGVVEDEKVLQMRPTALDWMVV